MCEFANSEPLGKVNLIGVGVDRYYPDTFPVVLLFYLYLRCVPEPNDLPGNKKGRIRLIGEDGLLEDHPIRIHFTEDKPVGVLIYKPFGSPRRGCSVSNPQWKAHKKRRAGPYRSFQLPLLRRKGVHRGQLVIPGVVRNGYQGEFDHGG